MPLPCCWSVLLLAKAHWFHAHRPFLCEVAQQLVSWRPVLSSRSIHKQLLHQAFLRHDTKWGLQWCLQGQQREWRSQVQPQEPSWCVSSLQKHAHLLCAPCSAPRVPQTWGFLSKTVRDCVCYDRSLSWVYNHFLMLKTSKSEYFLTARWI